MRVGLPIGLQNHNHGGLCGTGADVLRFVQDVNHPNLTVVVASLSAARRGRSHGYESESC